MPYLLLCHIPVAYNDHENRDFTFRSKYNLANNYFIPYQIISNLHHIWSLKDIALHQSFVYMRIDRLTYKMSDSDERFEIVRDIKPYNFEPFAKKVRDSIICEEVVASSADVDPGQLPVVPIAGPGPQQELD